MRVCVINSIFPPYARGGAEMVAYGSAVAFAEAGHEVFVITCAPFGGGRSFAGHWESVSLAIRVFRFTPLNLFSIFSIAKYPRLLRLIWHAIDMVNPHTYLVVRRILTKEKPDLILTHNLKGLGYSVHLAIHHSRYNKQFVSQHAKWFHTIHDMGAIHPTGLKLWGKERSVWQSNPLVWLYARINKKLLGDPDVVISPSQFLLDEYRNRGFFPKSRIAVVRNPVLVHNPTQPPLTLRGGEKKSSPLRSDVSVGLRTVASEVRGARGVTMFLYVGQLEPYKGLRLLLDVWRRFAAAHKECELHIAGEGSIRAVVEHASGRMARVQYHGFVPHEKLGELFSRSHFTIIPSLAYENSPTTIGESFSYGVPIVASRIGGIPEIVEDGVNGILFEPGDRDAMYDAMEQALKAKWETLSKNALRSVEYLSLDQYRDTLMQLCGR